MCKTKSFRLTFDIAIMILRNNLDLFFIRKMHIKYKFIKKSKSKCIPHQSVMPTHLHIKCIEKS